MLSQRRRLAIVVVLGGWPLGGCSTPSTTGGPATTSGPVPSATASAASPSAASSSTAPSTEPSGNEAFVQQLPVQPCCSELALEPGAYALPGWLGPLLRLEVPRDWAVVNDASARYLAFGTGENSVGTFASLVTVLGTPAGTRPEDIVDALRARPTLIASGEPVTVDVAGFEATELVATAKANPERTDDPAADIAGGTIDMDAFGSFVEPGFRLTTSTPEAMLRFLLLEVDDRVVIAWVEAPAAEANTFFPRADELLGSLARQ